MEISVNHGLKMGFCRAFVENHKHLLAKSLYYKELDKQGLYESCTAQGILGSKRGEPWFTPFFIRAGGFNTPLLAAGLLIMFVGFVFLKLRNTLNK